MFKYIDNHREEFNKWELEDFVANFDKNGKILNLYLKELDLKTPIGPKSKEDLKRYFKAFFARDLFGQTGFYMVTQEKDNMITKVIELNSN